MIIMQSQRSKQGTGLQQNLFGGIFIVYRIHSHVCREALIEKRADSLYSVIDVAGQTGLEKHSS